MKKLFVAVCVVLMMASVAYAVDFQTSGSYNARGRWISNPTGLQTDAWDYGFYDHELDMTTRIVVSDDTVINVNYEIHDSNWLSGNHDGWNQDGVSNLDDNIEFKRVFSSHTFTATGTTLDLGLMTGGAWATEFANTAQGRYRVKVKQSTPIGPLFAILEKNAELGGLYDDSEKDDYDAYYLAMVTKIGPVNFKPLLGYIHNSAQQLDAGNDGLDMYLVDIGLDGSFDAWGFEIEFQNKAYDIDNSDDYNLWGIYGMAYFMAGPAKIYGIFAYGNEDEGNAFGFGDDFEPTLGIGYDWQFGPIGDMVSGATQYLIGADFAVTDALSFNGQVTYIDSNMSDNGTWDNADAWEFDLGFKYKITDAVTYDGGFCYFDIDLDEGNAGQEDPDGSWKLQHRFTVKF